MTLTFHVAPLARGQELSDSFFDSLLSRKLEENMNPLLFSDKRILVPSLIASGGT